jgi:hypothetical protein
MFLVVRLRQDWCQNKKDPAGLSSFGLYSKDNFQIPAKQESENDFFEKEQDFSCANTISLIKKGTLWILFCFDPYLFIV